VKHFIAVLDGDQSMLCIRVEVNDRFSAVVDQHRRVASEHIVRLDAGDGQVVHLFVAVVVTDGFDRNFSPGGSRELFAGAEVGRVDPFRLVWLQKAWCWVVSRVVVEPSASPCFVRAFRAVR
jgi:hypothetical protein